MRLKILFFAAALAALNCQNTTESETPAPKDGVTVKPSSCPTLSSVTIKGVETCTPTLNPLANLSVGNGKYFVDVTFNGGSTEHLELSWPSGNSTGHFTCSATNNCGYGTPSNHLCTATGTFDITKVGPVGGRIEGTVSFDLAPFNPATGGTCNGKLTGNFSIIRGADN